MCVRLGGVPPPLFQPCCPSWATLALLRALPVWRVRILYSDYAFIALTLWHSIFTGTTLEYSICSTLMCIESLSRRLFVLYMISTTPTTLKATQRRHDVLVEARAAMLN